MKQVRILELLTEASRKDCDVHRLNAIQVLLENETLSRHEGGRAPRQSTEAEAELLLGALFNGAVDNAPELLPSLLPFFAMICGDRKEGQSWTDVDWKLAKKQQVLKLHKEARPLGRAFHI